MSNSMIIGAQEWLKSMKQPFVPSLLFKAIEAEDIMNPSNAFATPEYVEQAEATATEGPAPQSLFEGMQTIADLARAAAGFNPLDPEGTGDKAHFLQFSQNISEAPFLSLLTGGTVEVEQSSTDASKLIDSFVDCFYGIAEENILAITSAVTNLVEAALSYAETTQKYSNFSQNLLKTNDLGVEFHLYSSQFEIYVEESKGVITYYTKYEVLQGVYQLSQSKWDIIQPQFEDQLSTAD